MKSGLDTGQPVRPSAGRSTQKGNWLNLGNPQQPQKLKVCGSLHLVNLGVVTVALKLYSDGRWLGIWIFIFCVLSTSVLGLSLAHQVSVGCGLGRAVTGQLPAMVLACGFSDLIAQRVPWPCSPLGVSEVSRKMTL